MDTSELVQHCQLSWYINVALHNELCKLDRNVKHTPFITELKGAGVKYKPAVKFERGYHQVPKLPNGYKPSIVDPEKFDVTRTTTLGRLVKKCVSEDIKDDTIRSFVEEFKTMVDPEYFNKFGVLPNTIEQYYHMFEMNNGSCLQARSTYYGSATQDKWVKFYEQHRLHPGAWLMYNPNLQGVYMVNDKGATVARCCVYLEDGVPVAMDIVKALGNNGAAFAQLVQMNLLKPAKRPNDLWKNVVPFKMDGFQLDGDTDVYFPWPTLDNPVIIDGLFCGYNPETRQLHVAMKKDDPILAGLPVKAAAYRYGYSGFMKASGYDNFVPVDKASLARAA